jgi:hypothetical protein
MRRDRAFQVVSLAAVPLVLAAGEDVELARLSPATLRLALAAWLPGTVQPEQAADTLWAWWSTWCESPASWPVALAALEQMLP